MQPFFEKAHRVCQLGPLDYSYARWASESGQGQSPFTGPYVTPEIRQKANFDLSSAKAVLASSTRPHVYLNANVTELLTTGDGKAVTRVEFRDAGGRLHRVRAGVIVLAAGGIENPRLLLASRSVHKAGIGNDDGLVGHFFMEHIDIEAGAFRPTSPEMFQQQLVWKRAGAVSVRNSLAIAESVRREEQLLRCFFHIGDLTVDHAWGYRSAVHILDQVRRGRHVHNLRYHVQNMLWDRVPLIAAAKWRLHLTDGVPNASGRQGLLPLRVTAEPSPNAASRVMLARKRDRFGVPRVALDWRINAADYRHVRRSLALFEHDVTALGLGQMQLHPESRWAVRGTYHHMGTTRMSDEPRRGVVDANCRVHGIDNLYVAGSSVFPTAGSGTPTLMIVALAIRLAEHLSPRLAVAGLPGVEPAIA
jgi:choline dehydrogenase-like flavoprotein